MKKKICMRWAYSVNEVQWVYVFLPRVIPLGHWMSDATRTCLSTPFMPDFSILAGSPQSDQYRKLQDRHTHTQIENRCVKITDERLSPKIKT